LKEIVIISGKGGTGKTSLTASFASLAAGRSVMADCDVDAADLHLILKPEIRQKTVFRSGHKATIRLEKCIGCGACLAYCRFGAVVIHNKGTESATFNVDPVACEGCGTCVRFCPVRAIDFPEQACGEWYVSDTRFGPLVHAKLGISAENSGKLVTLLRNEARTIAGKKSLDYIIIDGSPGIGCPVIASLTASSLALIVTEPTVSGDHDLRRIAQLTRQLRVPAMICINKWDINPEISGGIRRFAEVEGFDFAGLIRYGSAATDAQRAGKAVVECEERGMAEDIRAVWNNIKD